MKIFIVRFKRECLTSIFMLAICISIQGQNLVPNPSFEEYTSCPDFLHQLDYAFPWITPTTGSSDLLNNCGNCANNFEIPVCVPNNFTGYQQPHSGKGYAGIIVYNDDIWNAREYIQTSLETPLIAGETYWVSFYVSLGDYSQFASNNIGAFLSENPISSGINQNFNCCSPQINASDVITSKVEWTLISDCYIASGNEQYITIGNF